MEDRARHDNPWSPIKAHAFLWVLLLFIATTIIGVVYHTIYGQTATADVIEIFVTVLGSALISILIYWACLDIKQKLSVGAYSQLAYLPLSAVVMTPVLCIFLAAAVKSFAKFGINPFDKPFTWPDHVLFFRSSA